MSSTLPRRVPNGARSGSGGGGADTWRSAPSSGSDPSAGTEYGCGPTWTGRVPTRRVELARLQPADEGLEVATAAGAERPREVHGELEPARGRRGPRGGGAVGPRIATEPREPSGFERGNHVGPVRRERPEPAGAEQAGHDARGVGDQRRHDVGAGGDAVGDLHVRPRPALLRRRQRFRGVGHHDHRESPGRLLGQRGLFVGEDDEGQPRQQPPVRGRHRRVAPRKVGRVELDRREVVRLDVGRARGRVGADDLVGVEPDDVGGPVELDGGRGGATGVAVDLDLDREGAPDGHRSRRERRRADSGAQVREERVDRDLVGHPGTSDAGTTSSRARSSGCATR